MVGYFTGLDGFAVEREGGIFEAEVLGSTPTTPVSSAAAKTAYLVETPLTS